MKDMMSTCMKALCRHVKQNKLQTDTNFLHVGTCSDVFTRAVKRSEDKNKTVQKATLRCWQAGRTCGTYAVGRTQSPIEKV